MTLMFAPSGLPHHALFPSRWLLLASMAILVGLPACSRTLEVRSYETPKRERSEPPAARIVAAAIPHENQIWFIKALDTPERLEGTRADLQQIVRSIQFPSPDLPKFTLPPTWSERPGGGMSRMVLQSNHISPPVSFAVTVLSKPEEDWEKYLRDNLNRWRDQLLLLPQKLGDLLSQVDQIELASSPAQPNPNANPNALSQTTAYVVDWSGKSPVLARMMAASLSSPNRNPSLTPNPTLNAANPASPVGPQAKIPTHWLAAEVSPFQLARFTLGNDSDPGEVVVSTAKNDLESNAFMWQNQLMPDGESTAIQEAAKQALLKGEKFPLASNQADLYLFAIGDQPDAKALLIAILPLNSDQSLFVKMRGSRSLVDQERSNLIDFARSLSLP